jgi:hypothetical protein
MENAAHLAASGGFAALLVSNPWCACPEGTWVNLPSLP